LTGKFNADWWVANIESRFPSLALFIGIGEKAWCTQTWSAFSELEFTGVG
jgi:hypothetical protein